MLNDSPKKELFGNVTRPLLGAATIACTLALAYGIAAEGLGMVSIQLVNQVGPAILGVTCLVVAYILIKKSPSFIWSPLPWTLISCAAFYGFGPLAYHFATPETISFLDDVYLVDEKSLLRTHVLNALSIAVVFAIVALTLLVVPASSGRMRPYDPALTKKLMWMFLILAGSVKYGFVVPHIMGKLSYVLPGAIQHLSDFMASAIILMFILIAHGEKKYVPLLVIALMSEFAFGLLALSKTIMIQTALIACLGFWLYRQSISVLITSGLAIVLVYSLVLSPFVMFARIIIGASSAKETTDISTAIDSYESMGPNELAVLSPELQGWWARFSYVNVQAFAMERYDEGNRGNTLELLPYVFVPRLIDSNKPVMHSGREFTQLILGYEDNSHTGLGVFGEAYWNGGWPLVIVVNMYVGLVMALIARFAIRTMLSHDYVFLPIILLGLQLALTGLTDWFVPTFAGGLVEAVVWFVILYGLKHLLKQIVLLRPIHLSGKLLNAPIQKTDLSRIRNHLPRRALSE